MTNIIYLSGPVDDEFVSRGRKELDKISRKKPKSDIIIDINSPGGSVFAGLDLFGVIRSASQRGHRITTIASGHCASMGSLLIQAGDWRQIRSESHLHIHEVSSGAQGNSSELADAADFVERLTRQAIEIYARRSTLTAAEIHERMKRQEWWMDANQALEFGFVDEII